MTTDILMLMSTMTLRVAPKVTNKQTEGHHGHCVITQTKTQSFILSWTETQELTQGGQDGGGPEDLAHECRYEQEAAHAFPVQLLERVQHGDVTT